MEKRLRMGNKSIIILSCVIFIAIASQCQALIISNSTYKTGSSVTLNGTSYSVVIGYGNSTGAALRAGNMTIGLALGECHEFFDELLCYSDKDSTQGRFTIYDQNAYLELAREISDNTELNVGEPIHVNITINNTGRTKAEDISFRDLIPEGYIIDDVDGCTANGNSVVWNGNLLDGSSQICRYTLIGEKEASGILKGNLSYRTITGVRNIGLEEIKLTSITPDWVHITVFPESVNIGQDINIKINFTTNETFNLSLKLMEIPLLDHFVFKESSYRRLNLDGNSLKLNTIIKSNKTLIIDINITAIDAGTLPLNLTFEFIKDEKPIEFVHQFEIESHINPLIVSIEPDTGNILEPYLESHVLIYVQNPNPFYDIPRYNINIKSDLVGFPTGKREVTVANSHGKRIVFDDYYTLPMMNISRKSYISASVIGTDGLMKETNGSANLTLKLTPLGEITINKELNFTTKDGKNISIITVYVTSTYARKITNILVEESVPDMFYYRGTTSRDMPLGPGETSKAYSYEISAPYSVDNLLSSNISTTASYTYANKKFIKKSAIIIDSGELHSFLYPTEKKTEKVIPPIEEEKTWPLNLFVIFDIILFILVILYFLGINVIRIAHLSFHHIYSDTKHHHIQKKNEEFKKKVEKLSEEEKQIADEESQIESAILDITKKIEKENKVLPRKVGYNDRKIDKLLHASEKVQSKREVLSNKIEKLKEEDKSYIQIQEDLSKRKESLVKRNQELASNKIKLIHDMDLMRTKILTLNSIVEKMKLSKGRIENDWVTLKKSHLNALFSKIDKIEEKEKEIKEREKELLIQKKRISEEQKQVKKTLNISHNQSAK